MQRQAFWIAAIPSLFSVSLSAAPILDQSFSGTVGGGVVVREDNGLFNDHVDIAQSVTAGLSGQLTSVEIRAYRTSTTVDDLDLFIYPLDLSGLPDTSGAPLASASLAASNFEISPSTSTFETYDLTSANLFFTAGDMFAIVLSTLSTNGSSPFVWVASFSFSASYTGGEGFISRADVDSGAWNPLGSPTDFHFRTFVDPDAEPPPASVVPEPSSLALFAAGGLLCLGYCRRLPRSSRRRGDVKDY